MIQIIRRAVSRQDLSVKGRHLVIDMQRRKLRTSASVTTPGA